MSRNKDFLNYLRSRIDPQAHRDQIKNACDELEKRASAILIDRDLIADTPRMPEEVRTAQLEQIDAVLEDLAWRIEQLTSDLDSLDGVERNVTGLNRAARRRAEKGGRKVRIVLPPEAENEEPTP